MSQNIRKWACVSFDGGVPRALVHLGFGFSRQGHTPGNTGVPPLDTASRDGA